MAEYLRYFADPAAIHANCEDYRAGATIDHELDAQDFGRRKIGCPVLALWGEQGIGARAAAVLGAWRDWATDVRGEAIPNCGHFLAEEAPDATVKALESFL